MSGSSPSPVGIISGEDGPALTASTIVAQAVSGSHVVKIDGYSRTKGLGTGKYIESEQFSAGGHRWCMRYYPDGDRSEDADWISIYLNCSDLTTDEVKAEFKIILLNKDSQPVPLYSRRSSEIHTFSSKEPPWGFAQFIKRKDLEESPYLRDDAFSIRIDVSVVQKIFTEPVVLPSVVVPPSDMHRHLGQLLLAGEASDITFEVGDETFAAHRCVLAARSSVFKAELLGAMKERTATRVEIEDMEAGVFRALLHFIYTDSLPVMDEGDGATAAEMTQHLLVAADRYNMERLKLICEGRLCDHVCGATVATSLALAEQHGCGALKKKCFKFLTSPGNLKTVMASDGFEHLRDCPSVLEELVAMLAP